MARVRAALRRALPETGGVIRFGDIEVDSERRVVRVNGEEVHLTPNEYRLLQALLKNSGKVMTQRQLLNQVWGPNHTEHAQYLRVYMAQLRRKLEKDSARPRYFRTEPGVGYRLVIEE